MNDIPLQLQSWLDGYQSEIKILMETPETSRDPYAQKLKADMPYEVVAPLLGHVRWGQEIPFNDLCPYDTSYDMRTPVGCVATAAVQIMKYYGYPERGVGSFEYTTPTLRKKLSADFGNTVYEWGKMLDNYNDYYTEEQAAAVALASYHVGIAVEMDYDVMGSGGRRYSQKCRRLYRYNHHRFHPFYTRRWQ